MNQTPENWTGRHIVHEQHGRGLVLTDIADLPTHQRGKLLVRFDKGTRRWVRAMNCTLLAQATKKD